MTDHISPEKRSWNMRQIKSRDTAPEIAVRKILHKHNYRFRLNKRDLPGIPDIVLPKHKMIIFVHGCFWHRHSGCNRSNVPSSKTEFWLEKFKRTIDRDKANQLKLKELDWNVKIVWECQTKNSNHLENLVLSWFE